MNNFPELWKDGEWPTYQTKLYLAASAAGFADWVSPLDSGTDPRDETLPNYPEAPTPRKVYSKKKMKQLRK